VLYRQKKSIIVKYIILHIISNHISKKKNLKSKHILDLEYLHLSANLKKKLHKPTEQKN
jgi:hypothetical protein